MNHQNLKQPPVPRIVAPLRNGLMAAFSCPLTGRLMRDPVLFSPNGYSYERLTLRRWLRRHWGAKAADELQLITNQDLRGAIEAFTGFTALEC